MHDKHGSYVRALFKWELPRNILNVRSRHFHFNFVVLYEMKFEFWFRILTKLVVKKIKIKITSKAT